MDGNLFGAGNMKAMLGDKQEEKDRPLKDFTARVPAKLMGTKMES